MSWRIRLACERDMQAFTDIVNHYIEHGVIHFGDRPQSADEWKAAWTSFRERYPWLVAERDGLIDGIAYARRWNERPHTRGPPKRRSTCGTGCRARA